MADNRVLTKAKPAKLSSWIFRYAVKNSNGDHGIGCVLNYWLHLNYGCSSD